MYMSGFNKSNFWQEDEEEDEDKVYFLKCQTFFETVNMTQSLFGVEYQG